MSILRQISTLMTPEYISLMLRLFVELEGILVDLIHGDGFLIFGPEKRVSCRCGYHLSMVEKNTDLTRQIHASFFSQGLTRLSKISLKCPRMKYSLISTKKTPHAVCESRLAFLKRENTHRQRKRVVIHHQIGLMICDKRGVKHTSWEGSPY